MTSWEKYLQLTPQSKDLLFLIYKELRFKELIRKKADIRSRNGQKMLMGSIQKKRVVLNT